MACWAKEAALTANQRENGALPLHASKEVFMEEICKFEINNRIYTIFNVKNVTGKKSYVGRTNYETKEVWIEENSPEQMLFTLKHELAHVWLYENGHIYQDEEKRFTYEDICEYIALSNNSINRIVDLYLNSKYK